MLTLEKASSVSLVSTPCCLYYSHVDPCNFIFSYTHPRSPPNETIALVVSPHSLKRVWQFTVRLGGQLCSLEYVLAFDVLCYCLMNNITARLWCRGVLSVILLHDFFLCSVEAPILSEVIICPAFDDFGRGSLADLDAFTIIVDHI